MGVSRAVRGTVVMLLIGATHSSVIIRGLKTWNISYSGGERVVCRERHVTLSFGMVSDRRVTCAFLAGIFAWSVYGILFDTGVRISNVVLYSA